MAKRMKLIPESLYKQVFGAYRNPSSTFFEDPGLEAEASLVKNKKSILTADDVPDEIKRLLYQDFSRQLYEKQQHDAKKPLLVQEKQLPDESVSTGTPSTVASSTAAAAASPGTSQDVQATRKQLEYIESMVGSARVPKIIESMKNAGITINTSNNAVVSGIALPRSNIIDILRCLTDSRIDRTNVDGLQQVVDVLQKHGVSQTIFPPGVRRDLFTTPVTPRQSGRNRRPTTPWESL